VTAALANLTFLDARAIPEMKLQHTVECVINIVRSVQVSVFTRDQVVTTLANMAGQADCKLQIIQNQGIGFLVGQLSLQGSNYTGTELTALSRVYKKSAIGISRLCSSKVECREVERLGGVKRLVELCANPKSRNYSDSVLVASLAALRKMASFVTLDVSESFVGNSLVESFQQLRKSQESYV